MIKMFSQKSPEQQLNQQKKKVRQQKKKYASTLDWMDLYEVRRNAMVLRKGKREEIVKGVKIIPSNLFLEDEDIQMMQISQYRMALNNLHFPIYHAIVFNPVDVRDYISRLERVNESEAINEVQKALIEESLSKMATFNANNRELEFFLMIKGKDDKQFHKRFNDLKRFLKAVPFEIVDLEMLDYRNYLANIFENDQINDFYFAKGLFEILVDEYNLDQVIEDSVIFYDSDEVYELLTEEGESLFTFVSWSALTPEALQGHQEALLASYYLGNEQSKKIIAKVVLDDRATLQFRAAT